MAGKPRPGRRRGRPSKRHSPSTEAEGRRAPTIPATAKKSQDSTIGRSRPDAPDQLEGRNPVIAALTASNRVREVWIDGRARKDDKLGRLVHLAREKNVPCHVVSRDQLDTLSRSGVHNGVIGFADGLPGWTLKSRLDFVQQQGDPPFVVLLDEVQYEQNLGAVLRTAAAAGVHAVVIPTRRGASMTPVVQRIAMGGAEQVPVIREGLNSALATLSRRGVQIIGAEADGEKPYFEADFTGPLALVMGGEDHGLGAKVRSRCDLVVSIPVQNEGPVSSLNVSVAAGLLIYERLRQAR